MKKSVVVFLLHNGKLLILKRSEKVGSFRGKWGAVGGHLESGNLPLEQAYIEATEETGLSAKQLKLIRAGRPKHVGDFMVYPFLFESASDKVTIDWEHTDFRWIEPGELGDFETVDQTDLAFFRVFRPQSH